MDNVASLFKKLAAILLIAGTLICIACYFLFGPAFAAAVAINAPLGYLSLLFLAKDLHNLFLHSRQNFFAFRFIFRLACFAILLYLMLVKFHLNPVGVVVGLSLPIFVMMATLSYSSAKEKDGFLA